MRTEDSGCYWPNDADYPTGVSVDIAYTTTGSYYHPYSRCHEISWGEPDDTWRCDYCGTTHWIEDKELECRKCGGPREV